MEFYRKVTFFNGLVYINGFDFCLGQASKLFDLLFLDSVVLALVEDNIQLNGRNVFCYTDRGTQLWQIERPFIYGNFNFYSGFGLKDDNLICYTMSGYANTIDQKTGCIIASEFTK